MSISESEQYDLLDRLAEEFADRYRRGERPELKEYTDRYPELADDIRELFPAMFKVEQVEDLRHGGQEGDGSRTASAPPRQVGDYRILREIGRGGMGVVYEAEQVSLGRRVAIKILPRHVSSDRRTVERFRREARAAARLHHTNIVPVYEVGQDVDVRFYAMQFIQGLGLDAVITELRRLRDRAGPESTIKAGSDGPSLRRRGKRSGPAVAHGTMGRDAEVSAVVRSILSGRFDSGGGSPQPAAPRTSTLAKALAGGLAAPNEIRADRRAVEFDPALTRTQNDGAKASEATGSPRPDSPGAARAAPALPPSSSAILPGGTQLSSVESGRRNFFRSLAQIGRQVAGALVYAHARGVVHRDIKPSNLLLDNEGVVWIADFGLAKGDDEGLTHTGDILGTLRYMAPERLRGEGDARADVYALGLTLYELLTMRPGFESTDRLKMIEQIKSEEPPRPRTVDARIPRDLETIVLKAIEKDPKARYQSAEAMSDDLGRFLADLPIRARQVSAAERYWRWAGRNPAIAVLGGALTAVLFAVTVGSLLMARRFSDLAERQGNSANAERSARVEADVARKTAETARNAAQAETYRAMLSEVRALRAGHQPGWRDESLKNLTKLAVMPTSRRDWAELRTEAVASIGEFGVREVARLTGSGSIAYSLSFSPDSRTLVAASDLGNLDLWDVSERKPSGQLVGVSRKREGRQVGLVHFLPDGDLAFLGSGNRVAFLKPSGRPSARRPIERGSARALKLDVDRQGRRLAVSWDDGHIDLYDSDTGLVQRSFDWNDSLDFTLSPDSRWLAIQTGDTVRVEPTKGDGPAFSLRHRIGHFLAPAFSPDGTMIASVDDRSAVIWDLASRQELLTLRGHKEKVTAIAFSPDASLIATTCGDSITRIWGVSDGRELAVLPGPSYMANLAFSPDGSILAASAVSGEVCLYELSGRRQQRRLVAHNFGAQRLAFHPRLPRLASSSDDHAIIVWDAQSAHPLGRWTAHDSWVTGLTYSPDGSLIASSRGNDDRSHVDFSVLLWDAETGSLNKTLSGNGVGVWTLAFDPTNRLVASGATDGTVLLFDVKSGQIVRREQPGESPVVSVIFVGEGRHLLSGLRNGSVVLYDLERPDQHRRIELPEGCGRLAIDGRRNRVIVGTDQGAVIALSLPDLVVVHRLPKAHDGAIAAIGLHLNGQVMATGGADRRVVLRDADTFEALFDFPAWTGQVQDLGFDGSGQWLAYVGADKDVNLWDLHMVRDELAAIGLACDQLAVRTAESRSSTAPFLPCPTPGSAMHVVTGVGPAGNPGRPRRILNDVDQ